MFSLNKLLKEIFKGSSRLVRVFVTVRSRWKEKSLPGGTWRVRYMNLPFKAKVFRSDFGRGIWIKLDAETEPCNLKTFLPRVLSIISVTSHSFAL